MVVEKKYTIGMIGLGTMGCNLLLNIADHGFSGAGYDKNADKVAMFNQLGRDKNVKGFSDIKEFIQSLQSEKMPSNLIQAQRDLFGAHTYEIIGREGSFHTEWNSNVED